MLKKERVRKNLIIKMEARAPHLLFPTNCSFMFLFSFLEKLNISGKEHKLCLSYILLIGFYMFLLVFYRFFIGRIRKNS